MTYKIETGQSNLNASNISRQMCAVCDGLAAAGHRVVLVDRFDRYWAWRKWKTPLAHNRFEWQELERKQQ